MANRARKHVWPRLGFAVFAVLMLACATGLEAADQAPACSTCHDTGQKLEKSAHAALSCDTCHEGHEKVPHPEGAAKPACTNCHVDQAEAYSTGVHGLAAKGGNAGAPDCGLCHGSAHELLQPKGQAFRSAAPETCGMCHTGQVEQYKSSVHGQALARGVAQAPLCTDCHGEHKIIKHTSSASPVNGSHIRETCGSCHDDVLLNRKFGLPADRLVSFDSSFHGLAAKAGSQSVANCASCHGVHNILASSDKNSTVHASNLSRTCGQCHPGAGTRFAIGQIHVVEGQGGELPALRWIREFYWLLIPVTIGLMLLHNGGDWVRKMIRLRFAARKPGAVLHRAAAHAEVRMLPLERAQHAVLVLSFLTLVWTGFALKYPDQWWARPLLIVEGARSLVHRIAGAVFIAVSVAHVISLIVSRPLREHWKEMLPKVRDAREALSNFAFNMGLGNKAPGRSHHSYIEKAEYWAVVWGALVMIASGGILWGNNLAMRFLPKSWLDIATAVHFYEAVLATLAIVVWHFYSVIFDPDVYPLNTAFLTGVRETNEPELHDPQPRQEPPTSAGPTGTPASEPEVEVPAANAGD